MTDLWFPGADRSQPGEDGGSFIGVPWKAVWHVTVSSGFPAYETGFFPHVTVHPISGKVRQHLPANVAARALRNISGGVQTNRANAIQIEVIGMPNEIPFHPVLAELASWLERVGVPRRTSVRWDVPYPKSFGETNGLRLSGASWLKYSGHCAHMHIPENDHGDTGHPFPIGPILSGKRASQIEEEEELELDYKKLEDAVANGVKRGLNGALTRKGSTDSNSTALEFLQIGERIAEAVEHGSGEAR